MVPICVAIGCSCYTKKILEVVKIKIKLEGIKFEGKGLQAFLTLTYCPELDTVQECNEEQQQYVQNVVGTLRWMIEIGQVDILAEDICYV